MSKHRHKSASRWSFLAAGLSLLLVALAFGTKRIAWKNLPDETLPLLRMAMPHPEIDASTLLEPLFRRRKSLPLTPDLRAKGFNECMMPDPGPGLYAPYRRPEVGGRLFIPQEGGHTEDGGYDVLFHFHGHEAVRKTVAQITRGVVFMGLDLGINSGPYEQAFAQKDAFLRLYDGVEKSLRAQSGNPNAYIRHAGLSAWSAGYGAVNAILRYHAARIDAVVLLDGLHAGFLPGSNHDDVTSVAAEPLAPTVDFALQALRGEKVFYFSHSHITPPDYVSTSKMAAYLLYQLGLQREPTETEQREPFVVQSRVDQGGFHLREYNGVEERAHCAHTRLIEEALGDLIEPNWETPEAVLPTN